MGEGGQGEKDGREEGWEEGRHDRMVRMRAECGL